MIAICCNFLHKVHARRTDSLEQTTVGCYWINQQTVSYTSDVFLEDVIYRKNTHVLVDLIVLFNQFCEKENKIVRSRKQRLFSM